MVGQAKVEALSPLSPTSRQAECYLLDGAGSWHWAQVIY